jgi:surface polysaccharide O-acyltransferase-like enzyme
MTERNAAFDRFRGIGAVCVVLLHAPPLYHSSIAALNAAGWALRELCQAAVPYFFLLSGWMMGAKSVEGTLNERAMFRTVQRILALYLPWFAIYLALDVAAGLPHDPATVLRRFVSYSDGALETRGYHLWFLPSLLMAQVLVWVGFRRFGSMLPSLVLGATLFVAQAVADIAGASLPAGLVSYEGLALSLLCVSLGGWLGLESRRSPDRFAHPWRLLIAGVPLVWIEGLSWNALTGTSWGVHAFQATRIVLPAVLLVQLHRTPRFGGRGAFGRGLDSLGRNSTGIYVVHLLVLTLVPFAQWIPNGFLRANFIAWSATLGAAWAISGALGTRPATAWLVR